MTQHSLELTIRIEGDNVAVDVYEPESGDITWFEFMLSPDEHPEFDDKIGNEIYSWLKLWADDNKEGVEKDV